MVGHLMILNPRRKSRKAKAKRRTGGRRKMTAKQLKHFGPRRGKKKRKARKAETVLIATTNPRRSKVRRKHRRKAKVSHRRRFNRNPRRVARRRYRRNPRGGMLGTIQGSLMGAAIGACGALAVDLAIGNLPLPASLKTGTALPFVRIGGALLVGMLVGAMAGEEVGAEAAAGGMIVTVYQMAKSYLTTNMPSVKLARYVPMNRYLGNGQRLGFIRRRRRGMGANPVVQRVRFRRRMALGAMKAMPYPVNANTLGSGNPNNASKFRIMRPGGRGLGYIGPAKTLGRYVNNGR